MMWYNCVVLCILHTAGCVALCKSPGFALRYAALRYVTLRRSVYASSILFCISLLTDTGTGVLGKLSFGNLCHVALRYGTLRYVTSFCACLEHFVLYLITDRHGYRCMANFPSGTYVTLRCVTVRYVTLRRSVHASSILFCISLLTDTGTGVLGKLSFGNLCHVALRYGTLRYVTSFCACLEHFVLYLITDRHGYLCTWQTFLRELHSRTSFTSARYCHVIS